MNGYLLDTNIALLASLQSASLSAPVRRAIERGPVALSAISYWEVLLKNTNGKLDVGDPRSWWTDLLEQMGATPLALQPQHIAEIYHLPHIHADPFDRVLIGQAIAEDLTLLTTDAVFPRYASRRFRVIS